MDDYERRVRERAHQIWQEEGRPEGKAAAHWQMARELVAQEDNVSSMTKPNPVGSSTARAGDEPAEPLEAVENQGEFPTLTDQGDRQGYPVRKSARRRRQSKG